MKHLKKFVFSFCLFMSFATTLMSQNPFVTKADMIEDFNVSPNGEMIVYRELTSEGLPQVSMKNLKTGEITLVSSVDIMSNNTMTDLFSGADFLSDNVIVFCKDGYMVSFDIKEKKSKQLFELPESMIRFVKASNDGKGVYWVGYDRVYYASVEKGIVAQSGKIDDTVMSLTIDKHNRAFYTTTARKVYCFDGLGKEKDMTSEITELVAKPYLIEAAPGDNCFIVAGKEGVFTIDLAAGKSMKLMDNKHENPLYIMRLSPEGKVLYYNTMNEKRIIRKLNIGATGNDNGDIVLDIASERKSAPMPHTEDGIYYKVDELAEFPGGEVAMRNFIDEHFKQPATRNQGMVTAVVVVGADGQIGEIKVVCSEDVKKEILRVIGLMPKWKPAKVGGKPVPMFYSISFTVK